MPKFRAKPIKAVQWDGVNCDEIESFIGDMSKSEVDVISKTLIVRTEKATVVLPLDNWLIREQDGYFYILGQKDFERIYEPETK